MDRRLSTIILILLLSFPATARSELKILEGKHTVIYDIVNPRGVAFIPDYANESFEQKVISQDEYSKRVRVTSRMSPMKTRVPFPVPERLIGPRESRYLLPEGDRQSTNPSIVAMARRITRGSRYAHEAASAVLSWIADNITFDTSITVPSDALSALRYRKAYCVGYSNLAVALLRSAGIPARIAHGYLPPGYEWGFSKEYWGVKVNDGGFHAYLEIYYPDTGWVFADAEHSINFVDPFHIILRLDGVSLPGSYKGGFLEVDKATFYTIYKEENKTMLVDELPLPKTTRLGRRLDGRQHAALVTGSVTDESGIPVPNGSVVLWREGRGTPTPFSDGRFAAALSAKGDYRVELKGPGFAKSSRHIQVEQGHVYRLDFALKPGGVIRGKVFDTAGRPVQEGDVFYREGTTSYGVSIGRDGSYRIEGLAPGQYRVSALVNDKEVVQKADVAAGKETIMNFVLK